MIFSALAGSYRPKSVILVIIGSISAFGSITWAETTAALPAKQASHDAVKPGDRPVSRDGGWRINIGAGMLYAPSFMGSKDYQLFAFPSLSVSYGNLFFASMREGIGYNIINSNGWRVGPIIKYHFSRKEDGNNPFRIGGGKSTALQGLGDVEGTLEGGGFAEYRQKSLVYKIELRQGIGGHNGIIGDASVNYSGTISLKGPPIIYAFGPRTAFADSDYINAYYGINQTQSANSGLNRYHAGSGLVSYGAGGFMLMPLYPKVSISLFGGYDRLGNEAADSPLIRQRGSANQFAAGFNITYKIE